MTPRRSDEEYMAALEALCDASMRLADAFPHYGEANGYPEFLPSCEGEP